MLKTVAVSALLASIYAAAIAPAATEAVEASAPQPQMSLQHARLPAAAIQPRCSQTAWPHYDETCIRNAAVLGERPAQARQVRIVTIDRRSK
jgi:hypothetical protein